MDIDKLNETIIEARSLIESDINVIKKKPNGDKQIIKCTFIDYTEGGVGPIKEVGENTSRDEMSYRPKAILSIKSTNKTIDKFPLKMVINAIKSGDDINYGFFEQNQSRAD